MEHANAKNPHSKHTPGRASLCFAALVALALCALFAVLQFRHREAEYAPQPVARPVVQSASLAKGERLLLYTWQGMNAPGPVAVLDGQGSVLCAVQDAYVYAVTTGDGTQLAREPGILPAGALVWLMTEWKGAYTACGILRADDGSWLAEPSYGKYRAAAPEQGRSIACARFGDDEALFALYPDGTTAPYTKEAAPFTAQQLVAGNPQLAWASEKPELYGFHCFPDGTYSVTLRAYRGGELVSRDYLTDAEGKLLTLSGAPEAVYTDTVSIDLANCTEHTHYRYLQFYLADGKTSFFWDSVAGRPVTPPDGCSLAANRAQWFVAADESGRSTIYNAETGYRSAPVGKEALSILNFDILGIDSYLYHTQHSDKPAEMVACIEGRRYKLPQGSDGTAIATVRVSGECAILRVYQENDVLKPGSYLFDAQGCYFAYTEAAALWTDGSRMVLQREDGTILYCAADGAVLWQGRPADVAAEAPAPAANVSNFGRVLWTQSCIEAFGIGDTDASAPAADPAGLDGARWTNGQSYYVDLWTHWDSATQSFTVTTNSPDAARADAVWPCETVDMGGGNLLFLIPIDSKPDEINPRSFYYRGSDGMLFFLSGEHSYEMYWEVG